MIQSLNRKSQNTPNSKKILIVDDDKAISKILSLLITKMGYSTCIAHDGVTASKCFEEALEIQIPFDLAVIDLHFPGKKNGYEILQGLQKIDGNFKALICTGDTCNPICENCEDYGFVGSIPKPFDFNQLQNIIVSALGM